MAEQTASQTVAGRVRKVRGGMSRGELVDRLRELGYVDDKGIDRLSVGALGELERGTRRVTVDDWLALSAALGVAPVNLIVPFEDAEPLESPAPELGIFNPSTLLEVAKNLVLVPLVARAWVRGRSLYAGADRDLEPRFYYEETPPPRRYQLDDFVEAVREGRKPKVKPMEDSERRFGLVKWPKEAINELPASLLATLIAKELQEEEGQ
jgi:Fe2+ transport system protein FeoA